MSEDQLYLLSCVFAARADGTNLRKIIDAVERPLDIFDVVCVLWPELDDPENLRFLLCIESSNNIDTDRDQLLVSLLGCDSKLIFISEMDNATTRERCTKTKLYVDDRLKRVEENPNYQFTSSKAKWLRNRMVTCDDIKPENTALHKQLWMEVMQEDAEITRWIKGIVEPLVHLNKRIDRYIKIKDFEKMDPLKVSHLMINDQTSLPTTNITRELIPYLKNNRVENIFLDNACTVENFPLNSYANYRVFLTLLTELKTNLSSVSSHKMQVKASNIIFENCGNLLKVRSMDDLVHILQQIDDNVEIREYNLTAASLKLYSKYMDTCLPEYDLKSVYALTLEEESAQSAHFASIIKDLIAQVRRNPQVMSSIFQLMDPSSLEEHPIFTHLTKSKQTSILIETALEMGDFDLLHQFIVKYDSTVEEDVLLKYFWHFFNNASNGLRTRPEMVKADKTLDLLLQTEKGRYGYLKALMDVANELSNYSLNLGKGIPFKPSDILTFTTKPFDLISLLLELNQELYKDPFTLTNLLIKLKTALRLDLHGDRKLSEEELAHLLSLRIDHSLVNMDFSFAIENTEKLLKFESISEFWVTIFQVGKYISPNWKDGEIPTEVLVLQLEILGNLLHICPIEEVEAVASQWSGLELELTTRDALNDPYSLRNQEGSQNLVGPDLLLHGMSSSILNLLSGK